MKLKIALLSLFALFLITTQSFAAVENNQAAPDFSLTDIEGTTHALSDFKGKYVVLEWINPDCPFVKKHYDEGHMQALQAEYTGKDVVWLAISSSAEGKQGHFSNEEWKSIVAKQKINATAILIDEPGKVGRLYGAKTTPHMYIINPEGTLIYQGAIDSMKSTNPADIQLSENYVRSALDDSMAGKEIRTPTSKAYGCSVKY